MAFDFPNSPTNGQTYTPAGGPTYTYVSADTKWTVSSISATIPITTGVYTPTHYLGTNMAASTSYQAVYTRIADRVIVSGLADIDPTTSPAATTLGISLPVASDLASQHDCTGTFGASAFSENGSITGDVTNNNALFNFLSTTANNHQVGFVFQYRVL